MFHLPDSAMSDCPSPLRLPYTMMHRIEQTMLIYERNLIVFFMIMGANLYVKLEPIQLFSADIPVHFCCSLK